jgi:hypothetical protein
VLLQVKGYTVTDLNGEKVGKVDDLFTGRDRQPRYLGVKMGFLGTKMTFIPIQLVTNVDPSEKAVTVAVTKDMAKEGPVFERDHEFNTQDEAAIWNYYGLGEPAYVMTEMLIWEEAS